MILSVLPSTMVGMHPNPWRRLAHDWPQVQVEKADLGHVWGRTEWYQNRPPRILLNSALTQVERRVTVAHECEHLDWGMPCQSLRASQEQKVLRATARYLMPDLGIVAQAVAVYDLRRAAEELWVTFPVLIDRLRGLSDAELDLVMSRRENVA